MEPIDGIYFSEILYADDTLIFGANTQCINRLLHAIERHSEYFGLKLNYDKCVNLTANQRVSSVRFQMVQLQGDWFRDKNQLLI